MKNFPHKDSDVNLSRNKSQYTSNNWKSVTSCSQKEIAKMILCWKNKNSSWNQERAKLKNLWLPVRFAFVKSKWRTMTQLLFLFLTPCNSRSFASSTRKWDGMPPEKRLFNKKNVNYAPDSSLLANTSSTTSVSTSGLKKVENVLTAEN